MQEIQFNGRRGGTVQVPKSKIFLQLQLTERKVETFPAKA